MEQEQKNPYSELKSRFDNFKGNPAALLELILTAHSTLHEASSAALALITDQNQLQILAIQPPPESPSKPPQWIAQAAKLLATPINSSKIHKIDGCHLLLLPAQIEIIGNAIIILHIENKTKDQIESTLQRSDLTTTLAQLNNNNPSIKLKPAMEILSAINTNTRFKGMAMALCS